MSKIEMNDHQRRLWERMLKTIESYRDGAMSLPQLVGELEGALDAGDFRDDALVNRFYDFWGPLEITNAVKGDASYNEVAKDVEAMQGFLLEQIRPKQLEKS